MPYIKTGTNTFVFRSGSVEARKDFKPGFMHLTIDPDSGTVNQVFSGNRPHKLPPKLYGGVEERANRIFEVWESRQKTTAILLTGVKGAGKTTLSKYIGNMGLDRNLPMWSIDSPDRIADKITILRKNRTKGILFLDEMDKMFSRLEDQRQLLGLFDGIEQTNLLIIASMNNEYLMGAEFHNRPGRSYYKFKYESLPREIIHEVLADSLDNQELVTATTDFISTFPLVTFDIITAIAHEMNHFRITAEEALERMNIETKKPDLEYRSFDDLAYGYGGGHVTHQAVPQRLDIHVFTEQGNGVSVLPAEPVMADDLPNWPASNGNGR